MRQKKLLTIVTAVGMMGMVSTAIANDVVEVRTFASEPSAVWQAWTDAGLISQWWGPSGFTAPKVEVDLNVGSATLVCMQAPGTPLMCNTWTYSAIEPGRELAFDSRFSTDDGEAVTAAEAGLPPGIPDVVPHRITFEPDGAGGTVMTVVETGYLSAEAAALSKQGLVQVLDKMQALVP